ncbi:MAG: hypothetical protein RL208_389, partial [Pseudomonadota bacterium]
MFNCAYFTFLVMLGYVVPFLIVISILVFVHEFGHYAMARFFNIHVKEFAIGFGPKLFGFVDKNGTQWKICPIPFGGYVKMLGDENAASFNVDSLGLTEDEKKVSLCFQKPYKRLLVALAGPVVNFLFAIVVYFVISFFKGVPVAKPVIGSVQAGSVAEMAGMKAGDRFLSVNGVGVKSFNDVRLAILDKNNDEFEIGVLRGDVKKMFKVEFDDKLQRRVLGISSEGFDYNKSGFVGSVIYSFSQVYVISKMTILAFRDMLLKKQDTSGIGGPVAIARESYKASQAGFVGFVLFMAMISTTLGLMNLFP